MNDNLVSIITPLYNSEEFVRETIESVLKQSYQNWEMIIVDDSSSDNGPAIVKEYSKLDPRVKLIRLEDNSGPAIARNAAIEESRGRYIAFLDSDDLWKEDKLEKQIEFMQENDIAFSFSSYQKMDEAGTKEGIIKVPKEVSYSQLLNTNIIGCLTAIYDTKELGKVYMPNIKKRQDYALWLKILKRDIVAYGFQEPLAYYRVRNNSVSSNKLKAAGYQWRIYREIEELNIVKSLYYFIRYAYYGFRKYKI